MLINCGASAKFMTTKIELTNRELRHKLWLEERNEEIESLYGDFGKRSSRLQKKLDELRRPPYTPAHARHDALLLKVDINSFDKDIEVERAMYMAMFSGLRYSWVLILSWGLMALLSI